MNRKEEYITIDRAWRFTKTTFLLQDIFWHFFSISKSIVIYTPIFTWFHTYLNKDSKCSIYTPSFFHLLDIRRVSVHLLVTELVYTYSLDMDRVNIGSNINVDNDFLSLNVYPICKCVRDMGESHHQHPPYELPKPPKSSLEERSLGFATLCSSVWGFLWRCFLDLPPTTKGT